MVMKSWIIILGEMIGIPWVGGFSFENPESFKLKGGPGIQEQDLYIYFYKHYIDHI